MSVAKLLKDLKTHLCGRCGLILDVCGLAELLGIDAKPYTFTYAELRSVTGDFNSSNKLGEGGFGAVYKVIQV